MTETKPEINNLHTLPESKIKLTLRRAEIIHWIQRGKTPQWYAHLYLQRGQGSVSQDAMEERITKMDAEALLEIMSFHNFLVKYALNSQVDIDELSEADYNAVLQFAQSGKWSEAEGESEAEALETFRAKQ